jgi:DNA-binding phage protein
MIDASPATALNHIHDCVLEVDVAFIMDTEELVKEQGEMVKMAVDSNVMLFSLIKEAL